MNREAIEKTVSLIEQRRDEFDECVLHRNGRPTSIEAFAVVAHGGSICRGQGPTHGWCITGAGRKEMLGDAAAKTLGLDSDQREAMFRSEVECMHTERRVTPSGGSHQTHRWRSECSPAPHARGASNGH